MTLLSMWKTWLEDSQSRELGQALLLPYLTMIQPLNHHKFGFYYPNPLPASPLPPHPYRSLHVRSFSLAAGDGKVPESKCQPGLTEPPFAGEPGLWQAKPNKASRRGLTGRDCSPSFTRPPPHATRHPQI